jgi:nucleoside-diphosphate-sugar epimerase
LNTKILVLGSEGFIGNAVIKHGLELGYEMYGIDLRERPILNYTYSKIFLPSADFDLLLESTKFDIIFNCSGSGNVSYSMKQPLSDFDLNASSVAHVLNAIKNYQPGCKYVHLSSAAVYGNPILFPITELSKILPVSPYGYHKWISEILCAEYAALYNCSISIVRPFSVYGPGLYKQLIWDVYQKAKSGEPFELWGTGNETRDFIFITDLVRALFLIATEKNTSIKVYNLASGNSISIRDLVNMLLSKIDFTNKFSFNNQTRSGDPTVWEADVSQLRNLGFSLQYSLEQGLEETAKWLKTTND